MRLCVLCVLCSMYVLCVLCVLCSVLCVLCAVCARARARDCVCARARVCAFCNGCVAARRAALQLLYCVATCDVVTVKMDKADGRDGG